VIRTSVNFLEKLNLCIPTGAGQIELIAKVGVPFAMCRTAFEDIPAFIAELVVFVRTMRWPSLEILPTHFTTAVYTPSNSASNMLLRAVSESR
jgi:hypothetical protein